MAIPDRYKKMGFTRVNVCKKSKRPGKKMMVLIKDGEKYRVIHLVMLQWGITTVKKPERVSRQDMPRI